MIRGIQNRIDAELKRILQRRYDLQDHQIADAEYPDPAMGDLSYTLAFPLAKVLRKSPKAIAAEVAADFPRNVFPEIDSLEVGGNGYLNFRLNRAAIAREVLHTPFTPATRTKQERVIVEHTNINPNKAAHVGHLRNACLGDTLVRLLRFQGSAVEVQNYIDDTGVQLADVVIGFQRAGKTDADLAKIEGKLDHYFWDLYAETHEWLESSPENKIHREQTLKAMEERHEPVFTLSQKIADAIIQRHLQTMKSLDIDYDLLPRESDIIGLKFWQQTFEILKEKGAITLIEEGKNAGCWVMSLRETESFEDMQNPDKVIVRSNGTVTYVGKDIAYQMWKFGLLGREFHYRIFQRDPAKRVVWTTTTGENHPDAPKFGSADVVYNVIDQRQSYLQKIVALGLRTLGYQRESDRSIHFSYEMVTLSPRTAKELGFTLSAEDEGKTFVEMSGRKGLGVKADDLIDRLKQRATDRIVPLYPDLPEPELKVLASTIAAGALRYFMLRYTRNTIITFDMDEALSFEGDTGPYLQYSLVRAQSIFRKLATAGFQAEEIPQADYSAAFARLNDPGSAESTDSWAILLSIIKIRATIDRALSSLEISLWTRHVFEMAQAFNYYYHRYPILHETDTEKKTLRIALVKMFTQAMETSLNLLGIPVPQKM